MPLTKFVFSPHSSKQAAMIFSVLNVCCECSNKNVIAYKDTFFDEPSSTLCIVMEFADSGDLYSKIMEH